MTYPFTTRNTDTAETKHWVTRNEGLDYIAQSTGRVLFIENNEDNYTSVFVNGRLDIHGSEALEALNS